MLYRAVKSQTRFGARPGNRTPLERIKNPLPRQSAWRAIGHYSVVIVQYCSIASRGLTTRSNKERPAGIEPATPAWRAGVSPQHFDRGTHEQRARRWREPSFGNRTRTGAFRERCAGRELRGRQRATDGSNVAARTWKPSWSQTVARTLVLVCPSCFVRILVLSSGPVIRTHERQKGRELSFTGPWKLP